MMPHLRRHHRFTWLPSAILDTIALQDAPPYTQLLAVGCPDDFLAVRVGLPNVTGIPWLARRIIARASATWSDYVNPTGDAPWVPLTFAYGGLDLDAIATAADAPTAVTVGANRADRGTGETANPSWTWTDWAPVHSLPRSDAPNGMRVLMLRMLVPQRQQITYANGAYVAWTGRSALHRGYDYATAKWNADVVTNPQPIDAGEAALGHGHNSIACVQFLTRHAGVTGMITGDSHHAGTSTATQFSNCLLRATVAMGAPLVGQMPLGYATCATGGARSAQFFPRLLSLLPAIRPGFVVLPGWTFNDTSDGVRADAAACEVFLARLLQAADACAAAGALPIFLTPFPRDAGEMGPEQVGPWLRLRNGVLGLRATGALVLDAAPLLGGESDGVLDGTYLPEMSSDAVHPNDVGHAALAAELEPLLQMAIRA